MGRRVNYRPPGVSVRYGGAKRPLQARRNPGRVPDVSGTIVHMMPCSGDMVGASLEDFSADGGGAAVVCSM